MHRSIAYLFVERASRLLQYGSNFHDGEARFIEGPEGCGKSTMMRAMTRIIPELVPTIRAVYVDATRSG